MLGTYTPAVMALPPLPTPVLTSTQAPPPTTPFKQAMGPAEYERYMEEQMRLAQDIPSEVPVKASIGKLGLMWPQPPYGVGHDAIPLLNLYAKNGCPVDCGPDWSREKIELLLKQGPHRSALAKKATIQLCAETHKKIKHGYTRVVRWGDIKNKIPPKLKISPIAMIPHKSKPFRAILDLSFNLYANGVKFTSVNETTNKLAPPQTMVQLGKTLH